MTIPDFQAAARDEKNWLLDEVEESASWYAFRTGNFHSDQQVADCAAALYELAEVIKSLPITHPLFLRLAEINSLYWQESDVFGLGNWLNETKCLIRQVCFSSFATPDDFIERLAELTEKHQTGCRQQYSLWIY